MIHVDKLFVDQDGWAVEVSRQDGDVMILRLTQQQVQQLITFITDIHDVSMDVSDPEHVHSSPSKEGEDERWDVPDMMMDSDSVEMTQNQHLVDPDQVVAEDETDSQMILEEDATGDIEPPQI